MLFVLLVVCCDVVFIDLTCVSEFFWCGVKVFVEGEEKQSFLGSRTRDLSIIDCWRGVGQS